MICIDLYKNETNAYPVAAIPHTVLALGNFDGVHLGHRALLSETTRLAAKLTSEDRPVFPGVWLFRDPPSDLLKKPPIPHLSTLSDKLQRFRECGIRYAFLGDFRELGSLSPAEFADKILQEECRCLHAVCGFNYSFGFRGEGTPEFLKNAFGGKASVISPVLMGGSPVSSTRIRTLLSEGNVREAALLLGRPYSFTLPVLHGKALGRTIEFPTVNQSFPPLAAIPRTGIYAVTVHFPWEDTPTTRYGIANIGTRPTVEQAGEVNCETYILDYSGDLYGKDVEIRFVERLRDERKMAGIEELKATIRNDESAARKLFGLPEKI